MPNIKEAKQFVKDWTGKGDEKQDTQRFSLQLLLKVYEDKNFDKDILLNKLQTK